MRIWSIRRTFLSYFQTKSLMLSILSVLSALKGTNDKYKNDPHVLRFLRGANASIAIKRLSFYAWYVTCNDAFYMNKYFGLNRSQIIEMQSSFSDFITISRMQLLYELSLQQGKLLKNENEQQYRYNKARLTDSAIICNPVFQIDDESNLLDDIEKKPNDRLYIYDFPNRTRVMKIFKNDQGKFYANYPRRSGKRIV